MIPVEQIDDRATAETEEALAAEADDAIIRLMTELRDSPGTEQHAALVAWARSPMWHPALQFALGWHGELARSAYRALRRDLSADTPGRRWSECDHQVGRGSIARLLGIDGDPAAVYAGAPFRTWIDDEGCSWIAGAIGCPQYLSATGALDWCHLDIRDVILWEPRSNLVRMAGEHLSASVFVMPDLVLDELTVWADPRAFFTAWAAARINTARMFRRKAEGGWAHPIIEAADSGLPGALLIGDIEHARWPMTPAATVIAGEGLTSGELHYSAMRSLRLPQFVGQ